MSETSSDDDSTGSSDDEFYNETICHLKDVRRVNVNKLSDHAKTIPVILDYVHVKMEPDSGADVNVMDEYQYRAYKHRKQETVSLQKSSTKLSTLQGKLEVKGEFQTIVRNQTRGVKTKFVVVKGRLNSPPLIGKYTLIELGMLQIKADGSLKQKNDLRIKCEESVKTIYEEGSNSMNETLGTYGDVFKGIGKIEDKKNNDEFKVKFSVKQEADTKADDNYKQKWNKRNETRRYSEHKIQLGVHELLKQHKKNKWSTAYETEDYIVYRIDGSSFAARRPSDGRKVYRYATNFKLICNKRIVKEPDENWREKILFRSRRSSVTGRRPDDITQTVQPRRNPGRRQLPKRGRRTPGRFSDYVT